MTKAVDDILSGDLEFMQLYTNMVHTIFGDMRAHTEIMVMIENALASKSHHSVIRRVSSQFRLVNSILIMKEEAGETITDDHKQMLQKMSDILYNFDHFSLLNHPFMFEESVDCAYRYSKTL